MAFTVSMPHTASAWAHLPGDLLTALRESVTHRPSIRPELTFEESYEQREQLLERRRAMMQRSNDSLRADHWPR